MDVLLMSETNVRNEISIRAVILAKAENTLKRIVCEHLITRIEVEKQRLTLIHDVPGEEDPDDPSLKIVVETEHDILPEDLVMFLITSGIYPFEFERWLQDQLKQYEQKLALDLKGGIVTIDQSSSK